MFALYWVHLLTSRQLRALGGLGWLLIPATVCPHSLMQFSHEVCHSCLDLGHLGPKLGWAANSLPASEALLPFPAWWDSVS